MATESMTCADAAREGNFASHQIDPEDDHSMLAAWVDDDSRFFAFDENGHAREYRDDETPPVLQPLPNPIIPVVTAGSIIVDPVRHQLFHRIARAVEPWYNWGSVNVERMDQIDADGFGGEGEVRFFDLQWFGIHIGIQFGRTPKAVRS